MFANLGRLFHRVSSRSAIVRHANMFGMLRNQSREPSCSLALESLEARVLLAGFDFGDITNPARLYAENDLTPTPPEFTLVSSAQGFGTDRFPFSLGRPAVVLAELSDRQRTDIFRDAVANLSIVSLDELTGDFTFWVSQDYPEGTTGQVRVSLAAGNYDLLVRFNMETSDEILADVRPLLKSYDLSIHADTASVEFSGGNPLATEGRNLGALSTATGNDIQEYIGLGNSGNPAPVSDLADMYLFDVVKQGTVNVTVTAAVNATGAIDFTLFRDSNRDDVFDNGNSVEKLETKAAITSGKSATISRILEPGRYGIAVFFNAQLTSQVDNYRLRTTYTVADGAGNSTATARDIGTLENSVRTFSDYLSPADPVDIYKFTTVGSGPFIFESLLTDVILPGTNFVLDLVRASDNGIILHDVPAGRETATSLTVAGTYFVKVRRINGEGPYTLAMSNRNTDLAGNTMDGSARNLGNFVFKELTDQVSSGDTFDFYKFELAVQSDFDVALRSMPAGTNAGLRLIRSNNGDSVIDPGELLASSNNPNNAPEFIGRTLTPGIYFVLVERIAGAPTYQLRLVHDRVSNALANAQSIAPGGGSNLEFLGPEDDTDVYKFALGTARQVGIKVELNNEPLLIRLGQDANLNGSLDEVEERLSKTISAGTGGFERINLAAGAYFLIVNAVIQDQGTLYRVSVFNATTDGAGNTFADARDIGTLTSVQTFTDFVGDGSVDLIDDLDDLYTFELGNNGPFLFQSVVQILNSVGNRAAGIELIRDDNLNLQRDADEIVATATAFVISGANAPGVIVNVLTDPGTYYLRVKRASGQVLYSLNLSTISLDTAGNSLDQAANLDVLGGTITSPNHFVGRIDLEDIFRFEVNNPGELTASLSGAPNSAYQIIQDIDNDLAIDPGEVLASAFGGRALQGVFLPAADDNYFVRVKPIGNAAFDLTLTFSNQTPFSTPFAISATNPTEIKAVRFDKGGEGVSYSDTTLGNNGDQPGFRVGENIDVDVSNTVDSVSTGRRVTNTAPGEFLEYMINVAEGGRYDFDVRVSSPDLGASFHIEIDGVSLSPPVAVPDTNSQDNMVTIAAASNVVVPSGPHILRLVFDTGGGANNFAGSYNFITIRPASAGTLALTPPHSVVTAGEHANVSLAWTVPVGGWTVLKQVDLRLRDELGRLIWIRFDEAHRTFSLYNSQSGKFGPAQSVGSNNVLSGPLVDLYLGTTTVNAAGANAPTVVLNFDLRFKSSARGHYSIEASAGDDLGHSDPFVFAGTLDVV